MDEAELHRDLAAVAAAHVGLVSMLDELLAAGALDGGAPSRLPGWSVGHVLTHVARNADSVTRVVDAAGRGEVVERYRGGNAGRDADIQAGAGRPAAELVADVRASAARLEEAWAGDVVWEGRELEADGTERPIWTLVEARWREVEVHRADLGLGYHIDDWPSLYVRVDLRALEMRWRASRPMGGLTGLPSSVLAAPPRTRLAWLLGRAEIDGAGEAGLF